MVFLLPLLSLSIQQSPRIVVDPLLLVEAREVWSVIGRPDNKVWPGWDARKTPILIYFPGKQDLLVNHPKPPSGFVKYTGALHSAIGPIYVKDGPTLLEFDGQNTSMDVNGIQTLVVADTLSTRRQWAEGLAPAINAEPNKADVIVGNSLFSDPYAQMEMFAHEAFHVYQNKMAPGKGGDELSLAHYPALSIENNVGTALEAEFLKAALKAKTDVDVRMEGLKWLAIRDWRRSVIGKTASDYEDGTEFSEGTAKYVEYRTLQSLEGRTPSHDIWLLQGFAGYKDLSSERESLLRQMEGFMSGKNIVNNDPYGASGVRFRLYFSGMGVGALMDRLGAKWHDRILKTGASLTDLAREALHPTNAETESALAAVKSSKAFSDLWEQKSKLATDGAAYGVSEVAKFAASPAELVLDYSQLASPKVNFVFTPFGILNIDEDRTMFRLVPISGKIDGLSFKEDGARPLLQDRRTKTLLLQLTGLPTELGPSLDEKEIRLPGVTLKNVRGKVVREGSRITVVLAVGGPLE